jgi:hypothetical protein
VTRADRIVETRQKNDCFKKFEDLRVFGALCVETPDVSLRKSPVVAMAAHAEGSESNRDAHELVGRI